MSKRAFLVLGPEASGNRFVTKCFVKCGCYGHDGDHQFLDHNFEYATDPVVWRRSLPYGVVWPDLDRMLGDLRRNGFDQVRVLALLRTHRCTVEAQMRDHGHLQEGAERNITMAVRKIASFVLENALHCRWVTYESLVNPEVLRGIFLDWSLDPSNLPAFEDANEKYFNARQNEPTS